MSASPGIATATVRAHTRSWARTGMVALALYSLGHFFIDLYSAVLGVFQPLLIGKLHFSLAQAGMLGGMLSLTGSVTQPVWGYLADRVRTRLFSALGPAITGVFISCLGLAPSYGMLLAMIALAGAGMAAFHPQASSLATRDIERNRQRWMAVFISAGTLGLAVGPAFFSELFSRVGIRGAAWGAIPGVVVSAFLLFALPDAGERPQSGGPKYDWTPLRAVWKPMSILYAAVFIRSIVQVAFAQFLPLYLSRERGYSLSQASGALSLYLLFGALGGFVGGQLADRFGGKRIILISMAGCLPFFALFFFGTGVTALAGLVLGGLVLLFTIPVNVTMAQDLVPTQAGTASALMMGFAWGLAGLIFIPLTGWAADHISLHSALAILSCLPAIGFVLSWRLPE